MGDELISKTEAQALIDLEEEFERELKRNALAINLLRERAEEAKIAKSRAELSAQKKECMMYKLRTIQDNMAATTETLTKTQERIDKQEQVRAMVNSMKDKVNKYEAKLKMQKQNSQQLGMLGNVMPDFDFPEPLINYDEDEETEAQKDSEIESQIESVGARIEPVGAQIEPVEAQKQTSTDEAQKVEEEPQQIPQNPADHESDPHCDLNESVHRFESTYAEARSE